MDFLFYLHDYSAEHGVLKVSSELVHWRQNTLRFQNPEGILQLFPSISITIPSQPPCLAHSGNTAPVPSQGKSEEIPRGRVPSALVEIVFITQFSPGLVYILALRPFLRIDLQKQGGRIIGRNANSVRVYSQRVPIWHPHSRCLIFTKPLCVRGPSMRKHRVWNLTAEPRSQSRPQILEGLRIAVHHVEDIVAGVGGSRRPEAELGVQVCRRPAVEGKVVGFATGEG